MDNCDRNTRGTNIVSFPPDASSARQRSLAMKDQMLLDTVLNNMSQGVLMFDSRCADGLLQSALHRDVRTLDRSRSPGLRASGTARSPKGGRHVLRRSRRAISSSSGRSRQGKTSNAVSKSADGRVFSIVHKPIAGGGWIATHEDITDRQRAEERIVHMARHDALTDLPNRTMLRERLEYELKRVKRGECLAVLCLDLDHFKSVNDTLGHPVGDELLKVVAERLRRCIREPDTIARLGGDEFAIIMTGMHDPHRSPSLLAKRIRESIIKPYHLDGHQILADISIGISLAPIDATEPDLLLKNADMALYGAKADGRGTYRFFEPEMDARMKARRELEMDLRKALANGEFGLHYQPLVNSKTMRSPRSRRCYAGTILFAGSSRPPSSSR